MRYRLRKQIAAFLPLPIKRLLKKGLACRHSIANFYEAKATPFIAFKLHLLLWPLFKILQRNNVCLLANIADGTGHILIETDNFIRRHALNEIDRSKKYILILKPTSLSKNFTQTYEHQPYTLVCSLFLYYLTLPIIMKYSSITLDCGLSRLKWQPVPFSKQVETKSAWPKVITKQQNLLEWEAIYQRRNTSPNFFPLKKFKPDIEELSSALNFRNKKLALVHIKTACINATAKETDPHSYLSTLAFLSDCGYQLVFVGREKMPDIFKPYDMINYAESKLANFKNDIQLFDMADLAITGGSGIFFLADCLNTKLLYLNYWQLFRTPANHNCICVPTLVEDIHQKRMLSFSEQWNLYYEDNNPVESFPSDYFNARNASDDEILAACKELIEDPKLRSKTTNLQQTFNQIPSYLSSDKPVVSEYFLRKHAVLFNN